MAILRRLTHGSGTAADQSPHLPADWRVRPPDGRHPVHPPVHLTFLLQNSKQAMSDIETTSMLQPSVVLDVVEFVGARYALQELMPVLNMAREVSYTAVEDVLQSVLSQEQVAEDPHLPSIAAA